MILNFLWLRICGYIGDNATLWKNGQPKKKYKLSKNKRSLQNPAIRRSEIAPCSRDKLPADKTIERYMYLLDSLVDFK